MELQYFGRTLTLDFMLTSQVLSLGHIVFRGLEVFLLVHHASVHPINYHLKLVPSKNDFPKSVVNSIINKTLNTPPNNESSNSIEEKSNEITIYFRFPYYGDKGFSLFKSCICKIKANCKKDQPVTFRLLYDVTKLEFFCSTKDRTPKLN